MILHDILFASPQDNTVAEDIEAPACFADLNLDQIIAAVTAGKQEYNLAPFFYTPLRDTETIRYRQEVMQDLENEGLLGDIEFFAQKMGAVRRYLVMISRLDFKYHKEGWLLEAVQLYCDAVAGLERDLSRADLHSRGLLSFREYVTGYVHSEEFVSLAAETQALKADLATVQHCVLIKENRVKVRKYNGEPDYSIEIEKIFAKFKQGAVKDYLAKLPTGLGMNHVEAQILNLVAKLYPDIFAKLDDYCARNSGFQDATISAFDREIQFYVAYLRYIARFRQAGLKFCYPQVSANNKQIHDDECFDLALAGKRLAELGAIVCNDFYLQGNERILIVSGPNQGGKTTFARTFGQLHYLASLGCPVPGREAQLFLFDNLFTHFENEENIKNLRGKLQDDLVRIRAILDQATSNSIIIMNEIFTSTTFRDALYLGAKIIKRVAELDLLCVFVTFLDELVAQSSKAVSMVSTVAPTDPTVRTFKIIRKPADGLAYAISIAEKYRLTYDHLKERIKI